MKTRKFFAGMSAAALAMSLAVPAFASNLDNPNEVVFQGANPPATQVNITLPASSTVVLNPYGMSAAIGEDMTDAGFTGATDPNVYIKTESTMNKLYSPTEIIINESTSALNVKVTATGDIPSGSMVDSFKATNTSLGDGEVYAYLELADLGQPKEVDRTINSGGTDTVIKDKELTAPTWKGTPMAIVQDATNDTAREQDTGFTIKAAEEQFQKNPVTGAMVSLGVQPSYTGFHLAGDVGTPPNGVGYPWAQADKVEVTVAFTFTPAAG